MTQERKHCSARRAAALLGVSARKFDALAKQPDFPRPFMRDDELRWWSAELEHWKATRWLMRNRYQAVCQ